jgi:hypothetical protein
MHETKNIEDYFLLVKQGEEQGFNYFFGQLYEPLVHFAFTIVNDKSEAEDIVEDSFVKFWQRRTEIEKAGAVKSYLYTNEKIPAWKLYGSEKFGKIQRKCGRRCDVENQQVISGQRLLRKLLRRKIGATMRQLKLVSDLTTF